MNKKYSEEFNKIIEPIISNDNVLEMKKYIQHGDTDCFEHCLNVAYYSYKIAKKLHLDYVSLTRAAMLHDFFLYDWRDSKNNCEPGLFNMHAFTHGKRAYVNASKYFKLSKKEKDIIENHMWPVTIKLPRYLETYIITLTDKYSTLKEMKDYIRNDTKVKYLFYNVDKDMFFNVKNYLINLYERFI